MSHAYHYVFFNNVCESVHGRKLTEESWQGESSFSSESVRIKLLSENNFSLWMCCMGLSRLVTVIVFYLVIVLLHLFSAFDNSWLTVLSDISVKTNSLSVTMLLAFSHRNMEALSSILLSLFITPLKGWHCQIPTEHQRYFCSPLEKD